MFRSRQKIHSIVMAGLGPAIHNHGTRLASFRGCRHKAGQDDLAEGE